MLEPARPPELNLRVRDWGEGAGMVYLGLARWDGMWRSRQQLMSRFARVMPVLYVEPWVSLRRWRRLGISARDMLRDLREPLLRQVDERLWVYRSPVWLPIGGQGFAARATWALWLSRLKAVIASVGINRPILWTSLPHMEPAVGQLGEILSVYHVVDEYAGYTGVGDARARRMWTQEARLLDTVDLTLVASPTVRDAKQGPGRHIELVENAVDFQAFRAAAASKKLEPPELARIPRPRLGYSGLVGRRLNLDLLLRLAKARPEWSIVLLGTIDARLVERQVAQAARLPNFHLLGARPVEDVPYYVKSFDVALMPYQRNLETLHISPLKLYEYLALGRPVISTDIPAARRCAEFVTIAEDGATFEDACARALAGRTPDGRQARIQFAAQNTWDNRVDQVTRLISGAIARRPAVRAA
jgi:glycosyltransferase involved in cell wall biosynthesis